MLWIHTVAGFLMLVAVTDWVGSEFLRLLRRACRWGSASVSLNAPVTPDFCFLARFPRVSARLAGPCRI